MSAPSQVPDQHFIVSQPPNHPPLRANVVGVEIPIGDLASLAFRWSIAIIPTGIFWFLVYWLVMAALEG